MKKLLFLSVFLSIFRCFGQVSLPYSTLQNLKNNGALSVGDVYVISDLGCIYLMAKTPNSFYERPLVRTKFALDYDDELFDFDTKIITGFDNIYGIIRCTNQVWTIIFDAGHTPYKVGNIVGNGGNTATINFQKTYDKVISFQYNIDEAYAAEPNDITIGCSVSFGYATMFFYKNQK